MQVVSDQYRKKPDVQLPVEFESESIVLDVPMEGITLPSGWNIFPSTKPVVSTAMYFAVTVVCE